MTSKLDVIKEWLDLPPGDLERSAAYLSEDFQSFDSDGNVVLNKETWTGMGHVLQASFTGFQWVNTALREEGDFVIMTGHFEGTHTSDLDLSAMGAGVIPASGKKIVWPDATSKITVEGGKIAGWVSADEGGGMEDFLAVLKA
jgi:hypothetical protein